MTPLSTANLVSALFTVTSCFALLLFMKSPRKRRNIFHNMISLNSVQLFAATCMTILFTLDRSPASAMAWGLILCIAIFCSEQLYEQRTAYQDYLETNPKTLEFKDALDKLIRNVGKRKPWHERER